MILNDNNIIKIEMMFLNVCIFFTTACCFLFEIERGKVRMKTFPALLPHVWSHFNQTSFKMGISMTSSDEANQLRRIERLLHQDNFRQSAFRFLFHLLQLNCETDNFVSNRKTFLFYFWKSYFCVFTSEHVNHK